MYKYFVLLIVFVISLSSSIHADESVELVLKLITVNIGITVVEAILLVLAVFLYAKVMLSTRRRTSMSLDDVGLVKDEVAAGHIENAITYLHENPSLFASIILPGLKLHNSSHMRIVAAMQGTGLREIGVLKQKLSHIAHIGVLAPLIGMLGTVIGISKTFAALGSEGSIGMRSMMMAGGISEALGATILGLLVGVPALGGYYVCLARVGRLGNELECIAEEIAATLIEIRINDTNKS